MGTKGMLWLLSIAVAVQLAITAPQQKSQSNHDTIIFEEGNPAKGGSVKSSECRNYYQVDQFHPIHKVALNDPITFVVVPTHPSLALDIIASKQERYQAIVRGAAIKLEQCNMDLTDCETMEEKFTKSIDLLNANELNYVDLTLEDSEITISVNQRKKVIGKLKALEKDHNVQQRMKPFDATVALRPMGSIPNYSVNATVDCNDTNTPLIFEVPLDSYFATVKPQKGDPFPTCPVYEVRSSEPRQLQLKDSIHLAVFPSQPLLRLNVSSDEIHYLATVSGTMPTLHKCSQDGTHCEIYEEGGTKSSDTITANAWNYVTVTLVDHKISIRINSVANVMRKPMVMGPDSEYATVTVVAVKENPSSGDEDYSIRVNEDCRKGTTPASDIATETSTTYSPEESTSNVHDDAQPREDNTTEAPEEASGMGGFVIFCIVLAVIIVIGIIVAIIYFVWKKSSGKGVIAHTEMKTSDDPNWDATQQRRQ